MKYVTKLIISSLLIAVAVPTFAVDPKIQQAEDKLQESKQDLEKWENIVQQSREKLTSLESQQKSNAIKIEDLNEEIKELQNTTNPLEEKKKDMASLDTILKKQKENMVLTAVKFLNIPYESYTIETLAISTYEKGRGTKAYNDNQEKLRRLKKYKADQTELYNFVKNSLTSIPAKSNLNNATLGIIKDNFDALRVKSEYANLGEDANNTYLGKILNQIQTTLKEATPDDTEKLRSAFNDYSKQLEIK